MSIRTLLVANRGEIARRIQRTARDMGIRTIAVHAEPDADAPFAREADEAVALGGETSTETYLDIGKILDAAKRTGADAVHPGYGFLAENAAFARAVVDAGLTWVGPSPTAIAAMGDKLAAKRAMREAGVPTLEAIEVRDPGDVGELPALLKAAAGGGGKGMRILRDPDDVADAIAAARRESSRAFGDDTLFVEPYLEGCRHVEIQVFGDAHGNVIHCFERECSVQRRYQKIVEEAPSPAVDDALREAMGRAAVTAAEAIGYQNAGTVEFLLDADGRFFFCEMNTRLQVEHPVTEAITGLDLVREQLLVAEEEPLSVAQDDIAIDGHAIEARLYAEDPSKEFLPAAGTVLAFEPDPGVRIDSGVESGSVVSGAFDPLIAKVIAHAPTRAEAARRLATSLERTVVQGLTTNRDFLVALLRHEAFAAGDTTTDLLERIEIPGRRELNADEVSVALAGIAMMRQHGSRAEARVLRTLPSGWRNSAMPPQEMRFRNGDEEIAVGYASRRDGAFDVDGRSVRVVRVGDGGITVDVDGRATTLRVAVDGMRWWVHGPWGDAAFEEIPRFPVSGIEHVAGGLSAPMPGKIVSVHVSEGDEVSEGDLLVVMEGMKMEHRVTASHPGRVSEIFVSVDEQVAQGAVLLAVEGVGDL